MQKEQCSTISDENVLEILHTSYNNKSTMFFVLFLVIVLPTLLFSLMMESLWERILVDGFMLAIFSSFLYSELKYTTEQVVIFTNGIEYSNTFKKINCSWTDILKIEIISHWGIDDNLKQEWKEYNFVTSKGTFSLNERCEMYSSRPYDTVLWDGNILKKIYEQVRLQVPNILRIEKEEPHDLVAYA